MKEEIAEGMEELSDIQIGGKHIEMSEKACYTVSKERRRS